MRLTAEQAADIQRRMDASRIAARKSLGRAESAMAQLSGNPGQLDAPESKLHLQIQNHCDMQFPRWKYFHQPMHKKSQAELGAPDFLILLPYSKVICVECKTKTGKLRPEQAAWKAEAEKLHHHYVIVRSFDEFLDQCKNLINH